MYISPVPLKTWFQRAIFEPWEISHGFAARNFAHLYVVSGRRHSVGAAAKMQRLLGNASEVEYGYFDNYYSCFARVG